MMKKLSVAMEQYFSSVNVWQFYLMTFMSAMYLLLSATSPLSSGPSEFVVATQGYLIEYGYLGLLVAWSITVIAALIGRHFDCVTYTNFLLKMFLVNAAAIWLLGIYGQTVMAWLVANQDDPDAMGKVAAGAAILLILLKIKVSYALKSTNEVYYASATMCADKPMSDVSDRFGSPDADYPGKQ